MERDVENRRYSLLDQTISEIQSDPQTFVR